MRPPAREPLSRRAALAVALWAGYYLLALGLAGGLLFFAYAVIFLIEGIPPLVLVFSTAGSVIAAFLILRSSFPRWEKFQPPGPRLEADRHPRLFEEIRRIARDTRQRVPSEVYLGLDVNASVFHRGGFLGLFTRRVMVIGLPVLKILTQSQFRSVLVHEYGHYVGGDTRLGPWIYKTYAALQRTLEALEGSDSLWRYPFIAYARLFTRICLSISQRQELAADALAARIAGARACAQALRLMHQAGIAYPQFLNEEYFPIVNAGFRAPLCDGLAQFLATKEVSRALLKRMNRDLADRKRDPYRTHPPLPQRLTAVAGLPSGPEVHEDPPAIDLLPNLDEMEMALMVSVTGQPKVRTYPLISWTEAAEKAFLPHWREQAQVAREHLTGVTPEAFPDLPLADIGRRFQPDLRIRKMTSDTEARGVALNVLGTVLLVSLRDRGWSISMVPGERIALVREGTRIEPFHVFFDLAEGKFRREEWQSRCQSGGFHAVDLGTAAPAVAGNSLPEEQGKQPGSPS